MARNKNIDLGAGLFSGSSEGNVNQYKDRLNPVGRPKKHGERLIQKSYYLTEKQIAAITIKTATSDLDKSGVVRAALDQYLVDIIVKL